MRVSVVIPSIDARRARRALESVIAQSDNKADEIIVAGRNLSGVKASLYKNLKVINETTWFNAASARNLGAQAATCDILLFMDDDCLAPPNWIQSNINALSEGKDIAAVAGRILGLSAKYFARCVDLSAFALQQDFIKREVDAGYAATLGIKKHVFDRIGGFNPDMDMVEDGNLCSRIRNAGYKVLYDPGVFVYHDHHKDSLVKLIPFMRANGIFYHRYFTPKRRERNLFMGIAAAVKPAVRGTLRSLRRNKQAYPKAYFYAPGVFLGFLAWHLGMNCPAPLRNNLKTLILFVTAKCNLRCKHCFYWQRLNKQEDLTLKEIEAAFSSFGRIENLALSGGEPFLRQDLLELCRLFKENNSIEHLSIPTNGSLTDLIADTAEKLLSVLGVSLTIGLSLDGLSDYHDALRQEQGLFDKVMRTYGKLARLKHKYPHFSITVNPVITRHNADEIVKLAQFVRDNMPCVDNFWISLIRGSPKSGDQALPQQEVLEKINRQVNNIFYRHKPGFACRVKMWDYSYSLKLRALKEKRQIIPCAAGEDVAVIDANGDLLACELREPFASIKRQSFLDAWNSYMAYLMRKSIRAKECYCTHECFIHPSLLRALKRNPLLYFKFMDFNLIRIFNWLVKR